MTTDNGLANTWEYQPVPPSAVRLFRMVWQLENWLRIIVYVELRAARVDWESPIKKHVKSWPPYALENDKKLHHMSTPHQAAISYLTFGELWKIISETDNWPLFEKYFPPKDNVSARIEEVKAIRNRIAHLRKPHPLDENRLKLFLQDMEGGIKRFCTRYTKPSLSENDAVSEILEKSWPVFGYGIELLRPDNKWLYAPHPLTHDPHMNASLDLLTTSNHALGSLEGVIYKLTLHPPNPRKIHLLDFLLNTKKLHKDIIHIMVNDILDEISITIPAIIGVNATANLIEAFLESSVNCAAKSYTANYPELSEEWPEYILWPDNLLTFFEEEMKGAILDLPKN